MPYKISAFLIILSLLASSEALRLLVCIPMTSKSHSILGHGAVNRLLEAGHEVVHITSYPRDKPVPNLTEINVSSIGDRIMKLIEDRGALKLKNLIGATSLGDSILIISFVTYTIHKNLLKEPNVVKLLSDPNEKFDAVILEWFFTEINAGIPALFQAPLIWMCPTEAHWQALRIMDEIPNPAYTIDLFATSIPPLTFWQRAKELFKVVVKNLFLEVIMVQFERWVYYTAYSEIATKRGVTMPSYSEAKFNGSLMFVNSHPSVGGSMKLPQNVISIAGYHIDKTKPLPKDLQKLMDEATDGVIYFSMGTNVKADGMSDEMKSSLLNMFSKYKQTIIWKFESDMTDIPANVHLVKWAPQPSILAHPNLKLFITHGGQLSTTEAIHYGVPLVGIPVMADQRINMRSVENKGFGIQVTLAEDMAPELDAAVRKVLEDDTYKNQAKKLSTIYHDRTMSPGGTLAHWVEHVVRTRGAPHLRSPALDLSFYQKFYLDLVACLVVLITFIWLALKFVRKQRSKPKSNQRRKQKKN